MDVRREQCLAVDALVTRNIRAEMARRPRPMTNAQLAIAIGMPLAMVKNRMRISRQVPWRAQELRRVALVFGVQVEDLVGGA